MLGLVVVAAWPASQKLDLVGRSGRGPAAGEHVLPGPVRADVVDCASFAAGAISGEKERKTYEMLLASPLRPMAIVVGKLLASLSHLGRAGLLLAADRDALPALGGTSLYEVLATYLAMTASVIAFGMISMACGSYFTRTTASLVVSYLIILPLALIGVLFYVIFENCGGIPAGGAVGGLSGGVPGGQRGPGPAGRPAADAPAGRRRGGPGGGRPGR